MAPARQMAALLSLTGPGKVVRLPARYIKGGLIAGDADDDASGPSPPLSSFFFFTPHLYLVYYHDSLYTYTHTQFHTRSDGDIYIDGRSRKEQVGVGGVYLGRLYKLCDREQQEEQSGDDDLFCVMPSVRRILRGCFSFLLGPRFLYDRNCKVQLIAIGQPTHISDRNKFRSKYVDKL